MASHRIVFTIAGSCPNAAAALCAHREPATGFRERKLYPEALAAANPRRTVPTLVDEDGLTLTETSAARRTLIALTAFLTGIQNQTPRRII